LQDSGHHLYMLLILILSFLIFAKLCGDNFLNWSLLLKLLKSQKMIRDLLALLDLDLSLDPIECLKLWRRLWESISAQLVRSLRCRLNMQVILRNGMSRVWKCYRRVLWLYTLRQAQCGHTYPMSSRKLPGRSSMSSISCRYFSWPQAHNSLDIHIKVDLSTSTISLHRQINLNK